MDAVGSAIRVDARGREVMRILPRVNELVNELLQLMALSKADYTIFFRKLSAIPAAIPADSPAGIPEHLSSLKESFYMPTSEQLDGQWSQWLQRWCHPITSCGEPAVTSAAMQRANPKITWREWLVAPAYDQAALGDFSLIHDLQAVFSHPYDDPSQEVEAKYDRLKPREFFNAGGISHYSCSS
jgi:uncharacterized protein YdiU (UPF0061 family)